MLNATKNQEQISLMISYHGTYLYSKKFTLPSRCSSMWNYFLDVKITFPQGGKLIAPPLLAFVSSPSTPPTGPAVWSMSNSGWKNAPCLSHSNLIKTWLWDNEGVTVSDTHLLQVLHFMLCVMLCDEGWCCSPPSSLWSVCPHIGI